MKFLVLIHHHSEISIGIHTLSLFRKTHSFNRSKKNSNTIHPKFIHTNRQCPNIAKFKLPINGGLVDKTDTRDFLDNMIHSMWTHCLIIKIINRGSIVNMGNM